MMATKGRKRTRKGKSNDEPPPVKQKEDEFATLLEGPLEGPITLGHGQMEVGGIVEEGEKKGTLKWVPASNGEVPDDAVEGGWCQSTKETIYVARAKDHSGGFFPGGLKKSSQYLQYCAHGGTYYQQMATYEVLVNPGNKAPLQWVTTRGTIPPNAVEGGFSTPGNTVYIGRQSTTKKDIVPGYIDPSNKTLYLVGNRYKPHTFKTFEVLVIMGDVEIVEEVNRCTLSDISYDVRQSDVTEEQVTMATIALENKSSLDQTLTPTVLFQCSKSYTWNVGRKTTYNVEIKGGVPFLSGSDDVCVGSDGVLPGIPYNPSYANNHALLQLVNSGKMPAIHGGTIGQIVNQHYGLYNQQLGETPTVVTMKLGGALKQEIEKEEKMQVRVGPNSKVTMELVGLQKTLDVPFTGKINKVFKNGMTAEEDVDGTYTYSTLTSVVPAIVKEEKIEVQN